MCRFCTARGKNNASGSLGMSFDCDYPSPLDAILLLCSVKKYLDGDWAEARDILTVVDRCVEQRLRGLCSPGDVHGGVLGDGPSRTLLAFMGNRDFAPPPDWDSSRGRALISK